MIETTAKKTTGTVKVVVTSDRYGNETHGLELERELAAGVTDLDVMLVGRASTSEEELIRARRAKFEKLEQAGTRPFPNTFAADDDRAPTPPAALSVAAHDTADDSADDTPDAAPVAPAADASPETADSPAESAVEVAGAPERARCVP